MAWIEIPERDEPTVHELWAAFEGLPPDPATGVAIGWVAFSWELERRRQMRRGVDVRRGDVIVRRRGALR